MARVTPTPTLVSASCLPLPDDAIPSLPPRVPSSPPLLAEERNYRISQRAESLPLEQLAQAPFPPPFLLFSQAQPPPPNYHPPSHTIDLSTPQPFPRKDPWQRILEYGFISITWLYRCALSSSLVRTPPNQTNSAKSYEDRLKAVSIISKPLAGKKLTKKLYKLIKKASSAKNVKRGVKEVVKGLKKGEKGICLIAGDIYPIDVISHLAVLCEEKDTPYIYVPSKHDLGSAAAVKRPTSCVLVSSKDAGKEEKETYAKLVVEIKEASSA